jgi:formylglycine-generating enzyme required for sulfatase activity/tRNA A-37 threonylcarbamoyl transferase component Bud32
MNLILSLSTLALRKLVDDACATVGIKEGGDAAVAVAAYLTDRFTDQSQRLTAALQNANERAWRALELSLAGESFWERCKAAVTRAEDKAFARQVRAFLDATPLPEPSGKPEFREQCLDELRGAWKAGLLTGGTLQPRQLAEQTAAFVRFTDPQRLLDAEWRVVNGMAQQLKEAGYANLSWLLSQRPPQGTSVLVAGARYFFSRAVEEDQKLFQGLAFSQLERLGKQQEEGFASLHAAMVQQGQRFELLLADVRAVVVETHSAVLDLQDQIEGQSGQIRQIGEAVQKLLEQHHLQCREVRPGDSLSIRNDTERQLVKQLVARYRALPEPDRRRVPALLNAVGKLEVVAGDFDAARQDFAAVATMVEDNRGQAEAHFNAYQVCLERRDWSAAIQEFIQAVKLDAKRFASFPVGKYQPVRILGAGGFGVAFLCKHKYMDAQVVVKTLMLKDLGRDADKVFTEAQVLRQFDHPAIIRISDCGYIDPGKKSRPFLVMDYFPPGMTLEEYVKKRGPLTVDDLLTVARQVAEGLHAAHGKEILHRDVKPANLLVRKDAEGWRVKVIDFGLALRQKVVQKTMNASTAKRGKTMVGESIAGTLDYAAPEQMGRRNDPVGPYSDVFGWAKTCCYALYQTTQPLLRHWQAIPQPLAHLLEKCLDEDPKNRPVGFKEVLEGLNTLTTGQQATSALAFEEEEGPRVSRQQRPSRSKSGHPLWPWLIVSVVGLLAVLVLLAVTVFRVKTTAGTVVVEIDQPDAEISVDGSCMTITSPRDKEPVKIDVDEGSHQLRVTKGGFETFTKQFSLKGGATETIWVQLEPVKTAKSSPPPGKETAKNLPPPSTLPPEQQRQPALLDCTHPGGVSAADVRRAQEAWAKYLDRKVEETIEVADGVRMTFVLIPPGKFLMGSPRDEKDRESYKDVDETLHEVTLTERFDMCKTEVTQAQYAALARANPSRFKGADLPVEMVSSEEACMWAEKLTKERGDRYLYRLPTEAEWEYACRGGRPSSQPFGIGDGRALSSREANFDGNGPYGEAGKGPHFKATRIVGSYAANTLGLYDMHGNVWEWCQDWYGPYPRGAVTNPTGPPGGLVRVFRGGGWNDLAKSCRAAFRNQVRPAHRGDSMGFRLARSLPRPP